MDLVGVDRSGGWVWVDREGSSSVPTYVLKSPRSKYPRVPCVLFENLEKLIGNVWGLSVMDFIMTGRKNTIGRKAPPWDTNSDRITCPALSGSRGKIIKTTLEYCTCNGSFRFIFHNKQITVHSNRLHELTLFLQFQVFNLGNPTVSVPLPSYGVLLNPQIEIR